MDIEEFVKDVLGQITSSIIDNKSGGKTSYFVNAAEGVAFDLAVTTTNKSTTTNGISGGMKVKVIGVEGLKQKSEENSDEQTSRVRFKVDVHTETNGSFDAPISKPLFPEIY